jgi:SAM-dependent methyltransferase
VKRTIICLAAKRSGTTAIHRIFVNHPDTKICHPNQRKSSWEPNFWNYAAAALDNDRQQLELKNVGKGVTPQQQFAERMSIMAPDIPVRLPLSEESIFELWDAILDKYGPIVFDKSPKYLSSDRALQLLLKYIEWGNDVRVFGIIRDPRDVIASQYELWHDVTPDTTPEHRDRRWVEYYQRFERFQVLIGKERCPLIRYEDLSRDPQYWIPFILRHCGMADIPEIYAHIRPVSIGRYSRTRDLALLSWRYSEDLKAVAARYGYDMSSRPGVASFMLAYVYAVVRVVRRVAYRVVRGLRRLLKPILMRGLERLPTPQLESLIYRLVAWRVAALPADEALRFLFRLDAALYSLQGQKAIEYGGGIHTKHRHMRYHDFFIGRIRAGERVLDIGCGNGVVAYDVAEKAGAYVTGIDLSAAKIQEARLRHAHPRVRYILGDVLRDLPAEQFDVVIMSNVLEHLEDRVGFLRHAQTAIRPHRWLIRVPLFERDWRVPLKQELGLDYRLDPTHYVEYTQEGFTDEMEQAGLEIVHQEVRWGEIWAEAVCAGERGCLGAEELGCSGD